MPPKEEKMNPLEWNVSLVHLIVCIYMHILSIDMIATIYLFIYFLFASTSYTPSTKHTIPMDDDDDQSIPSCPAQAVLKEKLSYTLLERSCCCCSSRLLHSWAFFNTYLLPYPTIITSRAILVCKLF